MKKSLKIFAEKFGGKEKSRTFAIPNEKRGTKVLKFGNNKFIEKTVNCTRSKYREYNKIYREALISLEIIMMNYHDRVKPLARFQKGVTWW